MTVAIAAKNMPATLPELQRYVEAMVQERGFANESAQDIMLLMVEEVGELAKAIRKQVGIKMASDAKPVNVGEEMADILIYLLDLANTLEVDLAQAFWAKEEKNAQRTWVK